MIVPNAQMIEQAEGQLKDPKFRALHGWVWPDQQKELLTAVPDIASMKPEDAYELGVQSARVLIAGLPKASALGVSF